MCSRCKTGVFEECIDKYCSEEESGRLQRAHMKQLYLLYLQVRKALRPKSVSTCIIRFGPQRPAADMREVENLIFS